MEKLNTSVSTDQSEDPFVACSRWNGLLRSLFHRNLTHAAKDAALLIVHHKKGCTRAHSTEYILNNRATYPTLASPRPLISQNPVAMPGLFSGIESACGKLLTSQRGRDAKLLTRLLPSTKSTGPSITVISSTLGAFIARLGREHTLLEPGPHHRRPRDQILPADRRGRRGAVAVTRRARPVLRYPCGQDGGGGV
jgi:hypothetical protein